MPGDNITKARISMLADPDDEMMGLRWDGQDSPSSSAPPANTAALYDQYSQPANPYRHRHNQSATDDFARSRYGEPVLSSPDASPPPPRIPSARRQSMLTPPIPAAAATQSLKRLSDPGIATTSRASAYSIPAPPPPPPVPPAEYESYDQYQSIAFDGGKSRPLSVRREPSMARRLIDRVGGTIKGRSPRWGSTRDRGGMLDEGAGSRKSGYVELGKLDEVDDIIPFDVSSWGPEFIPAPAVQAMEYNKMDADYAYTEKGEAIDLSNLVGFDGEKASRRDSDVFSLHRMGTYDNSGGQSYYFPPDRHVPNWKPISMRWWFMTILVVISLALAIGVEVLYQFSDRGLFQGDGVKGIVTFSTVEELTPLQFGTWKYLPTLVGVVYGILWKMTDTEIKRTEPYYQLSRGSKGALAAGSLNIEYQTFWSMIVPIEAVRHKQWAVVVSSTAYLLAFAVVSVLMSVFITITPNQKARKHLPVTTPKTIVVDAGFARLLEAMLGIVVLLGLHLMWQIGTRRSGLMGDPSGITGVAAMANKSHILMDFKDLDAASEEQIHKQLNKRTYILHKGALWQAQFLKESERDNSAPKAMDPHPLLLRMKGGLPFIALLLSLTVTIPALVKIPELNVVVDKTPWVLTGVAVLIKSLWEIVEKDIRMLEPFWCLFNRNAPASVMTLDYSATIPGFIIVKALFNGHFLLAWCGVTSLLGECLTVVMGSLDQSGGEESEVSFKLSFGLAIGILIVLIFSQTIVLHFRRQPFLPRQPGTISSVLAFIHQSQMLVDFEGTEEKSTQERSKRLQKLGKKYGFGWFKGRDGKRHLGIDHEPLLGQFRFGRDYKAGVIEEGGDLNWQDYERGAGL